MSDAETLNVFVNEAYIIELEDSLEAKDKRIKELKAAFNSDEEQVYVYNEVTGLHNMADLARIEELEAALHTYGRHHRTCSKWDELDKVGTPFIRTNWPCDCGLGKALGESK